MILFLETSEEKPTPQLLKFEQSIINMFNNVWMGETIIDNVNKAVEMAVGMANGGGGTVVVGVKDNIKGKSKAIQGIPSGIDEKLIQKAVYDKTDPHITAIFDWIEVAEGYGRILVMTIFPVMPPYTETNGKATIRKGKDCVPFTGSICEIYERVRRAGRENGEKREIFVLLFR